MPRDIPLHCDKCNVGSLLKYAATAAIRNMITFNDGAKEAAIECNFHLNLINGVYNLVNRTRGSVLQTSQRASRGEFLKRFLSEIDITYF